MRRDAKEKLVGTLSEKLQKIPAIILAEYRGLKVSELTQIRKEVKKSSGDLRVIKNRLVKKALQATVFLPLADHLKGPIAIALSGKDPVDLAKILSKYATDFEAFKLKVGFVSGRVLSVKEITALSKLPSKEELYVKLLGTLQAPMAGLARLLHAVPQKLVWVLKEVEKSKGG